MVWYCLLEVMDNRNFIVHGKEGCNALGLLEVANCWWDVFFFFLREKDNFIIKPRRHIRHTMS